MAIEALDLREAVANIGAVRERARRELALAKREQIVDAKRNFAAAQVGRLTFDWATSILSRDQKIWTDLRKLRARSRELADNDPTMQKFLGLCVANIIGKSGVKMQPKIKNLRGGQLAAELNSQIAEEWKSWCARGVCTVDGKLSFDELERLLIRTAAMDGEFLVIMRPTDNAWGFALQHMDMDQLDHTYFDESLSGGRSIRMGVEVDKFRRPLAYWLFNRPPNEWTVNPLARVRVPSESAIHAYLPDSALQTRGIPWAATAMFQMNMLRGYMEAEVTAARVGACQMGILINKGTDEFEGEGKNEDGTVKLEAQPGGFLQMQGDQDFKQFNPTHPSTAFASFVKEAKRNIASALGVAYTSLAEDLEGVNFSSIRAGLLNERDMWRVRQKWMIESFHKPVFKMWLMQSILSGRIDISIRDEDQVLSQIAWHPRGWAWVDPAKDQVAAQMSVQNGFTTRRRVLASQGEELESTLEELAAEEELIKSLGLKLGTDAKGKADAPEDEEEGSDTEGSGKTAKKTS